MAEETKNKKFGLESIKAFYRIIIAAVTSMISTAISGLKTELGAGLVFKDSVENFDALPKSGQVNGDMYDVQTEFEYEGKKYPAGTNVAWNGTKWDPLGGSVDLSNLVTTTTMTEELKKKADSNDISDMATQTWVGEQGFLTDDDFEDYSEEELKKALEISE